MLSVLLAMSVNAGRRDVKLNTPNGSNGSHNNKPIATATHFTQDLQKDTTSESREGLQNKNDGKKSNSSSTSDAPTLLQNNTCLQPKPMNGDPQHSLAHNKDAQSSASKRQDKSKASRRAIFHHYSPKDSDNAPLDCATEIDIRYFTPPPEQKDALRKRFFFMDECPLEEIQRAQELPPLPSPLLRYVSGEGVYPLVEPKSILRQGKYSSPYSAPSSPFVETGKRNSLSSSLHQRSRMTSISQPLAELKRMTRDMSLEESKQFFRGSGARNADHVKFDPRIVITEFSDEPERDWFTEDDLKRFRLETAMLAHHYMMLHPEVAKEYTNETKDSVTGKMRKKAIYSLLGQHGIDSFGTSAEIEKMVRNTIRNVLIVDPNKSILELFRKSIQLLFPEARIFGVQSGEAALRLYTAEMSRRQWHGDDRGFDVVIIEEKLSRHRAHGASTRLQPFVHVRMHSDSLAHPTSSAQLRTTALQKTELAKQDSLSNLESLPDSPGGTEGCIESGSQLIRRICQLEDQFCSMPQNSHGNGDDVDQADVNLFFPRQRRSLLIGVSVSREKDGKTLKESGADLVWGKPPPKMDNALRNQLISLLINKRQKASFCVRIPGEKDINNVS